MSSIKNNKNNQLTNATNYDVKRMIFSEPQAGSVPNTPIQFRRINISTLNKDGSIGDLVLLTERVFSFGTGENKNPETQKVNGHVLPLCLWSRNGATEAEKTWTDTFDKIVEHVKKYLIDNKEELGLYELEATDLKKLNPLYWKRDKGKIVEGTGPTLYAKLITSKKHNKIMSMFADANTGQEIDPLALIGKYCYVRAAIKFESIFIGNKISLQVKLFEAHIELMETGMKPLIPRPKPVNSLISGAGNNMNEMSIDDDDDFEPAASSSAPARTGSIQNSDVEEDEAPKPTPAPAKVVKKVLKKTK